MTNEEKADEISEHYATSHYFPNDEKLAAYDAAKQMAKWKDEQYRDVIEMLIDELNTSKLYHLGITGLDTDEEAAEKRRKGECSLIRGIERAINYAELVIEKK